VLSNGTATLSVLASVFAFFSKLIESGSGLKDLVEKLSRREGVTSSIIYFTIHPIPLKITGEELIEIIEELIGRVGTIEESASALLRRTVIIGKSRFQLEVQVTRLVDVLSYETLYDELVNVMQGGAGDNALIEEEELIKELGIDKASLENVVDATVIIYPEKVKFNDVHTLITVLVDGIKQILGSEGVVVKIRVSSRDDRVLNAMLKKLSPLGVPVYRGEHTLTVVLYLPTQIVNTKVFKVIYG